MATQVRDERTLERLFLKVRALSDAIAAPLSDADATVQAMAEASPAKWHLAHTSWFFETFVLRDHLPGYAPDPDYAYLFNSYYEGEGERLARDKRGMLTRPSLGEVRAYRTRVDEALTAALPRLPAAALELVELGLYHEQQHQELMLMDLTAAFWANPLRPALWPTRPAQPAAVTPLGWRQGKEGPQEIGHGGRGFAFDNEGPRHRVWLHPHALADRLVTNAEWQAFMDDGGYRNPLLWLADSWAWVQAEGVQSPLYWTHNEGTCHRFALDGLSPVNGSEPVCHISYYEAEAYARWAGARLPTEAEWECAAASEDARGGNQLDAAGPVRPVGTGQLFGDVWQWAGSAYLPYPGFKPAVGTVGEYNGKFMVSQMVLRGSSCATPRGHVRASYRNFFYPHQRWMFSGLRLARDI